MVGSFGKSLLWILAWIAVGVVTLPVAAVAQSTVSGGVVPSDQLPEELSYNTVIVIHGVLGSKLINESTQEVVWGTLRRFQFWKPTTRPADLAHPMRFGNALDELQDSIVSDGTLANLDIKLLGIPVEIEAYQGLMQALGVAGYRDAGHASVLDTEGEQHFTCFQFDYDCRIVAITTRVC